MTLPHNILGFDETIEVLLPSNPAIRTRKRLYDSILRDAARMDEDRHVTSILNLGYLLRRAPEGVYELWVSPFLAHRARAAKKKAA